jgi:Xaa-Pro dipeptidase
VAVTKQLAFTVAEYRERVDGLRQRMVRRGIDVVVSHTPENICYLSGYHTAGYFKYQCCVVPLEAEPFLIIREFELRNALAYSWMDQQFIYRDTESPVVLTKQALERAGLGRKTIGVEKDSWFLTIRDLEHLQAIMPDARFEDASGTVELGRMVKSPQEIEYIRQAAEPTQAAMAAGIAAAQAGATEDDIAGETWKALVHGSEYPAYAPFICSGPRTYMPHATWAGRQLEPGDAVFLEIGGSVHRYGAAMLRCGVVGEPTTQILKMADACGVALEETMKAMKPGVPSLAAHAACQRALEEAGFGGYHRHRTGYSMGIGFPPDWGEGHIKSLAADDPEPLQVGMVFHVIPSLPVEGVAGIALGETVMVTEHGGEALTCFDRQLFVK